MTRTATLLWALVAAAVAGDVVTTTVGLAAVDGAREVNPVVRRLLAAAGLPGLVGSKLIVLGAAVVLWGATDSHAWTIPASVATLHLLIVVQNARVIIS
jgi:hypothetical protein